MIDLHLHSTTSDGTLTPEQIVEKALALRLQAIALTDHDSVAGIEPALAAAQDTELLILPAVEISTDWRDTEVHILGYFLDYHHPDLLGRLAAIREVRLGRAREMVAKLQDLGVPLSYDEVGEYANGESVGRPHVAAALLAQGHVKSQQAAFHRYLGRGKPAYVPRYKLTPQEGIELIHRCHGLAVLAHPGLVKSDSLVEELIGQGFEGLEVYHTAHWPASAQKYSDLAQKYGLLITGGSDSHGPGGPAPVPIGSVAIPEAEQHLAALLDWARAHDRWPLTESA